MQPKKNKESEKNDALKNFVSIIIVNWNGRKWLEGCLDSISKQTYKNYEVILVDNASTDSSLDFVRSNYPTFKVVCNKLNLGFADGNNSAISSAKGDLILLLNNDTEAPNDYLEKFVKQFNEIPNAGTAQSKIIRMGETDKLDSCGSFWTNWTLLYHFGVGKNEKLPIYNNPFRVFTNKGASMLIRREIIDQIGLFDSDFWCYYEETDFCHRAWLLGYESWYCPSALVYHAVGGTSLKFDSGYIQFHNFKNKILSFFKNFEIKTLVYVAPLFFTLSIIFSFIWLGQGKYKNFLAVYQAIFWNIKNISNTIEKRKKIQMNRRRSDKEIFQLIKKSPTMSYYYYLISDNLEKYLDISIIKK